MKYLTQTCVLAHVTTQMEAIKGSNRWPYIPKYSWISKSNEAFGINGDMIEEARQLALREGTAAGPQCVVFWNWTGIRNFLLKGA